MIHRFLLSALMAALTLQLAAQGPPGEHRDHEEHEHHGHDHGKNELGVSATPLLFLKEKEPSFGLHLHYLRQIKESPFSIGLGYERIFDDHGHNTFGILAAYRPIDPLVLEFSPGLTIEDAFPGHLHFGFHIEVAYEFEVGGLHIGPTVGFAHDPEDHHIGLGVHIGFGF